MALLKVAHKRFFTIWSRAIQTKEQKTYFSNEFSHHPIPSYRRIRIESSVVGIIDKFEHVAELQVFGNQVGQIFAVALVALVADQLHSQLGFLLHQIRLFLWTTSGNRSETGPTPMFVMFEIVLLLHRVSSNGLKIEYRETVVVYNLLEDKQKVETEGFFLL